MVIDGRRAENLNRSIYIRTSLRDDEGIDIDVNIMRFNSHDGIVNSHQHGVTNMRFCRNEVRRYLVSPGNGENRRGLHDCKTKVHIIDHQTNGAVIDVVQQPIWYTSLAVWAKLIFAISVGSTDSGKTCKVGATQRHCLHFHRDCRTSAQI